MPSRYVSLTGALREALIADPTSFRLVSKESGLTRQSLVAFAKGRRSLRLDMADKLMQYYGFVVVRREVK